ncbi:RNA polymerase sigma factor [Amycolatopsis sp. FDAARGOS 1241]|uniref:RNA polymerase sigma factor n=1 Tax=Amycolatopsis sp. FDAARGOS 1241 TaxID=2778070 RepID=UPI00195208BB|nr:sigma-70 family RNA polymerase sigma factor [Amycolatopsis sp. FDAARGOS 1241]QRP50520.1 sigma-70 family RNA polymerase sigma factor [Amycolatopsis sp. FDAARGOS 1241]
MQVIHDGPDPVLLDSLDRPDLGVPDPAPVFGRLFDAHSHQMHRYLARRAGDDAAHDLVAETLLVALRRRESYRPELGTARSWLYGIATNLLRHHVRGETRALKATARLAYAGDHSTAGHDGRVAEQVDAQTRAAQLAGALAKLSAADRDTLLLVSWAGLEPSEVAEALGVPPGTIRSRLHRIRRWLRANAATTTPDSTEEAKEL